MVSAVPSSPGAWANRDPTWLACRQNWVSAVREVSPLHELNELELPDDETEF